MSETPQGNEQEIIKTSSPKESIIVGPLEDLSSKDKKEIIEKLGNRFNKLSSSQKDDFMKQLNENEEKISNAKSSLQVIKLLENILITFQVEQKEVQVEQKEVQVEQKEVQVEQKEVQVEQKEVQVEQKEVQVEQKEVQVEQKEEKEATQKEKDLEETKRTLQDIYSLFWGKDKFQEAFKEKLSSWRSDAIDDLKKQEEQKTGKPLEWEALNQFIQKKETEIETYVILNNRKDIEHEFRNKPEELKRFKNLFGTLHVLAINLDIPVKSTLHDDVTLPVRTERAIISSLVGYKAGDEVIRTGNKIKFQDQVIDISTLPPRKYIEASRLSIETTRHLKQTTAEKETREQRKDTLRNRLRDLTWADSYEKIQVWHKDITEKLKHTEDEKQEMLREGWFDPEKAMNNLFGSDGQGEAKDSDKIMDSGKNSQVILECDRRIKSLEGKLAEYGTIINEMRKIEEEERREGVEREKDLQNNDMVARENLAFFGKLHLGIIGQSGFDFMLKTINENTNTLGLTDKIDASKPISDINKKLITRLWDKVLGGGYIPEGKENEMRFRQGLEEREVRARSNERGIILLDGTLQKETFKKLLLETSSEKQNKEAPEASK